jgi:hypothetical protein
MAHLHLVHTRTTSKKKKKKGGKNFVYKELGNNFAKVFWSFLDTPIVRNK